jgi:hypothetical protein
MAAVLEECITEERRSVRFLWAKGLNAKKYFLFTVGRVCGVKQFTAGWQTIL